MPDGTRNRTQRFSAMLSHYVIDDRYGRPGKGNDKGKVEGLVGYGRRNFMVPMPRFADWDAFNDHLEDQCRKRQGDILRGHKTSIGARLEADLAAMQDLPAAPFEACDLRSGQVTSTSVARYRGNDYSVPVAYGHREVWIKGFVDRVVIGCAAEVIADHPRSYDTADVVFDPVHYLRLIEHKIMAFDQAAPLQGWDLPAPFKTLQRLLEARQGKTGKRGRCCMDQTIVASRPYPPFRHSIASQSYAGSSYLLVRTRSCRRRLGHSCRPLLARRVQLKFRRRGQRFFRLLIFVCDEARRAFAFGAA